MKARSAVGAVGLGVALAAAACAAAPFARADEAALERRIGALEDENARLRAGLREAAAALRTGRLGDAAEVLEGLGKLPAPEPVAAAEGDAPAWNELRPLERLRWAIRRGDPRLLAVEESALVARGEAALPWIRKAFLEAREDDVIISCEYVIRAIEGRAGAGPLIEEYRASGKKYRDNVLFPALLGKAALADAANLAFIEKALGSESDPRIQDMLIGVLDRVAQPSSGAPLASVLRAGKDAGTRARAARALGAFESPETGRALLEAARGDAEPKVRDAAIDALARHRSREPAPLFHELFQAGPEGRGYKAALRYFKRAGTTEDLPALRAALLPEKERWKQSELTGAIESIEERAVGPKAEKP